MNESANTNGRPRKRLAVLLTIAVGAVALAVVLISSSGGSRPASLRAATRQPNPVAAVHVRTAGAATAHGANLAVKRAKPVAVPKAAHPARATVSKRPAPAPAAPVSTPAPAAPAPVANPDAGIPQQNGGDADPDNNAGPNDGDGQI